MQINFSGTVDEIIELAEILRRGRKSLANKKSKPEKPSKDVMDMLRAGRKIEAIKIYKMEKNCGLLEAKNFVEAIPGVREILAAARPSVSVVPVWVKAPHPKDCPPECDCRGGV